MPTAASAASAVGRLAAATFAVHARFVPAGLQSHECDCVLLAVADPAEKNLLYVLSDISLQFSCGQVDNDNRVGATPAGKPEEVAALKACGQERSLAIVVPSVLKRHVPPDCIVSDDRCDGAERTIPSNVPIASDVLRHCWRESIRDRIGACARAIREEAGDSYGNAGCNSRRVAGTGG